MQHIEQLETRRLMAAFTASSVVELIADINAANAAGGSNMIALAQGTTFNLSAVDNQSDFDGANGLPVVAAGNDLTILGNGDIIGRSTTRGTPEFRLFDVTAGASLTLTDLTLSRGVGAFQGGAVLNRGTLSLQGVTVQNCATKGWSVVFGGGISSNGTLTIANSTIQNNQALGDNGWISGTTAIYGGTAYGGGLYVGGGTATVANSTFTSNLARGGDGADGFMLKRKGGIIGLVPGARGGNGFGGGIYAFGGTLEIRGTTLTANAAQGGVGGSSPRGLSRGANGIGQGGGFYIAPPASVGLDSFTQAHSSGNSASSSDNDVFGSFMILS